MKADALVLTKPRALERRTLAVPPVDGHSGVLRIEACGLCGTDHEQYSGHLPAGFAFVPGHEIVGVVEAVGDAASARWGVSAGDRVAVEVFDRAGSATRAAEVSIAGARATDWPRCSASST